MKRHTVKVGRFLFLHASAWPSLTAFSGVLGVTTILTFTEFARAQDEEIGEPAASNEAEASEVESAPNIEAPDAASDAAETAEADDGAVVESGGGLFEAASSGQDVDAAETAEKGLSLEWGGYVRGDVFVGTMADVQNPDQRDAAINAAYGEVAFQPRVKTGSWGGAFVDLRFRYGQQLDEFKLWVDPREAYASAYLGPVELRLGKQVVVWGRADGFNPTSNIAPLDFRIRSPVEDDRRIGTVGARGFLTFNPVKLEAVWMPLYEPTMYPTFDIDDTVTSFVDPDYPNLDFRNSLVAARLHLELSAFEASVSYLNGFAPLPGIALESFQVGSESVGAPERGYIHLQRRAYRQQVIGADFATTVSDWFGLRGEAAYRIPFKHEERYWAAKPDIQWVLGIDREFGPVSIIAQYLGKYTFDWEWPRRPDGRGADGILALNPNNPSDVQMAENAILNTLFNTNQSLFNQLHTWQTLASLRVEWKTLHETLSISALGLYNFSTSEWFVSPKIGYQITDGLNVYLGAEIYNGPGPDNSDPVAYKNGTLMDLIDEKLTAGYTELRASF